MTDQISVPARRAAVTVNYLGLVLAAGVIVVAFVLAYARTGIWRLTHRSADNLDEREIQLTHQALLLRLHRHQPVDHALNVN